MRQGEPPLWDPACAALAKTIQLQARGANTHFTIVAFKDKPQIPNSDILSFDGTKYGPAKQTQIDSLLKSALNGPQGRTNIVSALQKGYSLCNPATENRIYLFTDGKHNCPGSVEQCLSQWCANHPAHSRLFYVMMTPEAVDGDVLQCLDACDDAFAVECKRGYIPQIVDISAQITTSTHSLQQPSIIRTSEADSLPVRIDCNDTLFDVRSLEPAPGENRVVFTPRDSLSPYELSERLGDGDYEFTIQVSSADPKYFIANPTVRVTMKNLPPRTLQVLGGSSQPIQIPTLRWHDAFLWSPAAPDPIAEIAINPQFTHPDNRTALSFILCDIDSTNPTDYTLMYNGQTLAPDQPITIKPSDPDTATLALRFNHDAKKGRRTFTLTPVQISHLDIINGTTATQFPPVAVELSYHAGWNPLKTICIWLLIVLVALLLIWFLLLKPAWYPSIDVKKLQITAPGFYIHPRIKGCRCVQLVSRKQTQNPLARLFTGKILYIHKPDFTHNIRITKGGKRSVRFQLTPPWGISPTATVKQNGQATLTNTAMGKQYHINIY